MKIDSVILYILILLIIVGCGDSTEPMMMEEEMEEIELQEIRIDDLVIEERTSDFEISLTVAIPEATSVDVNADYATISKTATAGNDFVAANGTVTIASGSTETTISITILDDEVKEMDEWFILELSNPQNGKIEKPLNFITIRDNDIPDYSQGDGYETSTSIDGYNLVWSDEFDGDALNEENWSYELGNGCDVGICGWGNNERQVYTDEEENISLSGGKLSITAREEGTTSYSSARIITKGKQEYQFGRVDIRAKLPRGQGLWPALWMLGSNIDDVGWPACGELDIMELVGSKPKAISSAAHWGNQGQPSTFQFMAYTIQDEFAEHFHVFSIQWRPNQVEFYVDEEKFFTISPDNTSGFIYPFNNKFFFIMNVAVGGNLPGDPDETTEFPQTMEVDYIRVFQEN